MNLLTRLTLVAFGVSAFGTVNAAQQLDNYKLVVIQQSPGAHNILKGQYDKGIAKVAQASNKTAAQGFENAMAMCSAQIKLNALSEAAKACDWAVTLVDIAPEYQNEIDKYKALALNNRAIAKYLNDDNSGAYQDFNQAIKLHDSRLISANYQYFSAQLMKQHFTTEGKSNGHLAE